MVDLIREQKRRGLFPAGRLDRDTEGLLLITNDGELAHRLLSPRHHVPKTYFARVTGIVTDADVSAFASGLVLPGGLECLPASLTVLGAYCSEDADAALAAGNSLGEDTAIGRVQYSEVNVTIHEGKFHQIKRMFHALGHEVIYLKRLSMGTLTLDPGLAPGEYRRLTEAEIILLRSI